MTPKFGGRLERPPVITCHPLQLVIVFQFTIMTD